LNEIREKIDVIEMSLRKKKRKKQFMNLSPPTLTSLWIWSTMFDTQLGTQPTPFVRYHETKRQTQPTTTNIIQFNQTHLPNYSSKFMPSLSYLILFNIIRSKQHSCIHLPILPQTFFINYHNNSQLQLSTTLSSYLLFDNFFSNF